MLRIVPFILFLLFSYIGLGQEILHFSRIGKNAGLPDNTILSIAQDSESMIWIATSNSVVRYDGMSFQRFENDIDDPTSVSSQVRHLHLSNDSTIWCATPVGIQKFDEQTESFTSYSIKDYREGVFYSYITQITDYSKDTLLLLSATEGPILFCTKSLKSEYLYHTILRNFLPLKEKYSTILVLPNKDMLIGSYTNGFYFWSHKNFKGFHFLKNVQGTSVFTADSNGNVWFPYGQAIGIFSPKTKTIKKIYYNLADTAKTNIKILSLKFMQSKLYIGTHGNGLFVLDTATMIANQYRNTPSDFLSLPDNGINCIFQDNIGNIWVGTSGGGIAVKKKVSKKFTNQKIVSNCTFSRCNYVNDFIISKNGTSWAAMDGAGLNIKRSNESAFSSALSFPGFQMFGTTALCQDENGLIWLGTFRHGMYKLDTNLNVIAHYDTSRVTPPKFRLKSNFIKSIFISSKQQIWVATNESGVMVIDENAGIQRHFILDPHNINNTISCNDATSFFEDSENRIWVTTYWGINLFDVHGNFIARWVNDDYNKSNLSSNVIYDIVESPTDHFWLASMYGINHFNYGDSTFQCLSETDGLVNNNVTQLQVDKAGNIWAGTSDGLSKYDVTLKRFYNFYHFHGLSSPAFRSTSFTANDGRMYWGTEHGIVSFLPEEIEIDTTPPKVIITELRLFNKKVLPSNAPILSKNIYKTGEIELNYDQNFIGFEFSAQNFVDFSMAKFKYRLIGADKDWVITPASKRSADYFNLAPGEYTFQVHATNSDGVWSKIPAEVKIKIIPPFYSTAIFRSILITAILLCLIFYMKLREQKLQATKDKLEVAVAERTKIIASKNEEIQEQNSQLKILNRTKDMFFSIIAHDLKSPLNALMGFSSLLCDKYEVLPDEKKKKFIGVINDSSRNMYGLLVNLLDWSRSQTNNLHYEPAVHNLMPIVEESTLLISPQATQKSVHIKNLVTENYRIVTDINMLKTVIRNLLTNAIKFSFRDDIIEIGVSGKSESKIIIYIKDCGIGMSKKSVANLFSRNAGETSLGTEKEKGSGLGLIICKEFVEKNNGRIWCASEQGKGSTFYFTVPLAD